MASHGSARMFSGLQSLRGHTQKRYCGEKTEAVGERHGFERTAFPQVLGSNRGCRSESSDIEEDGGECAQRQLIRSRCARLGVVVRVVFSSEMFGVRNALSDDGWRREE
eukprot:2554638-Pleurochrysis_carterae.AAC.2